ncbi:protein turtle B, partial [Biomphalaria pfeifferi]
MDDLISVNAVGFQSSADIRFLQSGYLPWVGTQDFFFWFCFNAVAFLRIGLEPGLAWAEMTGNQQNTVFKTASLGGQQVLPCEIIYPPEYPDVQYVVTWTKQGLNDSLLIKFEGYNTQIQEQYKERIEIVNKEASLRISHIEPDDEGWYGCEVYFASSKDTARKTPSIKTWVYLTVH